MNNEDILIKITYVVGSIIAVVDSALMGLKNTKLFFIWIALAGIGVYFLLLFISWFMRIDIETHQIVLFLTLVDFALVITLLYFNAKDSWYYVVGIPYGIACFIIEVSDWYILGRLDYSKMYDSEPAQQNGEGEVVGEEKIEILSEEDVKQEIEKAEILSEEDVKQEIEKAEISTDEEMESQVSEELSEEITDISTGENVKQETADE